MDHLDRVRPEPGLALLRPPDGEWRAQVVERFNTVRGFVRLLCQVISFGATAEAVRVVNAMRDLPKLIVEPASVPERPA